MDTERSSNKKGKRFKKSKKKTNKKKTILVLLVVLIIAGLGFYFSKNTINLEAKEQRESKKEEVSEKLLEEKQYKDMKIKDITLNIEESASYFKCNMENTTDKKFNQEEVFVVFVKEDNSELARFKYHIDEIEAKSEEKISVTTTTSLEGANDFYIEAENKE